MLNKYVRVLEERDINPKTGETWKVTDVPTTWRSRVIAQIEADGYEVMDDGTVNKRLEDVDSIDESL